MKKRKSNAIAALLVLFAYILAFFVDSMPEYAPVELYFLSFMSLHLIITYLCNKSENVLVLIYGIFNFVCIALYFPILIYDADFAYYILWGSGIINFSVIMQSYEALVVIIGGISAGILCCNWITDVILWCRYCYKYN